MKTRKAVLGMLMLAMLTMASGGLLAQQHEVYTSSSKSGEGTVITTGKETYRWKSSTGSTDFNIEIRGKIEITDDDKDIKSISDDGYLEITKTVFGSKRAIVIESQGGGKMKKEYYEGRTQMAWEPNGRQWLGEIMPEIMRTTTLGAESRVNRFYKQGGTAAVLGEIGRLQSDHVRAHYFKLLLEKNLAAGDMAAVITQAANTIGSDYYLSTVLQNNADRLMATPESTDAFFKATQKVDSDYYKSVILKEALKKRSASAAQVKTILQSAAMIDSDYYKYVVLSTLLEQPEVKEDALNEMIRMAAEIDSDHYRTQLLGEALRKPGLSKTSFKTVVDAVANVESDYYKTNVFNSLAEKGQLDAATQVQIMDLISHVESDYYASVTLTTLLDHQKLSDEAFGKLIVLGSKLESDHYASTVLGQAAEHQLTTAQLLTILNAAGNINSDHYLTQVLGSVANQVKAGDASVKEAYRQAAKKISSETYYGRALRAIE